MKKRILLISSGGGHWLQLLRLLPAIKNEKLYFATVNASYQVNVGSSPFFLITDANRWTRLKMFQTIIDTLRIVLKVKPHFVISTGAAPGMWGIIFGKLFGSKTIWLDSIANINTLSLSGKLVRGFSDLYLTQWQKVAHHSEAEYRGSVL